MTMRWPVLTSMASAVMPLLRATGPPTCEAVGVNVTWMVAEAEVCGASWKLLQTTLDPLMATLPTDAVALVAVTLFARLLTTVWLKSSVSPVLLLTLSVMVQWSGTPTVGTAEQVAVWLTLKDGGGNRTVKTSDA